MIYKIRQITSLVAVTVRVWLDRGSVLSSATACLSLNFCPTFRIFQTFSRLIKVVRFFLLWVCLGVVRVSPPCAKSLVRD